MGTKKANQGAVTSIADTDLVMAYVNGGYHPISFADLMKAVRGGIQIGGRNLFLQQIESISPSASFVNGKVTFPSNADSYFQIKYANKSMLKVGKSYTISFDVEGMIDGNIWEMEGKAASGSFKIRMHNGRNVATFVLNENQFSTPGFFLDDAQKSFPNGFAPIVLSNFQLEEGNMATAFNLAPEERGGGNWLLRNQLLFRRERRCA